VKATSSDLIVDTGAGMNYVDVTPSAISGQLLFQSLGGTYDLGADDLNDTQTRHVTLGTFLVPPRADSLLALKPRLLGTIDGFSPGEIEYDPASLQGLGLQSPVNIPGLVFPFGTTYSVNDTFTPALPGAGTTILLSSADTVSVRATHGPLSVYGAYNGGTAFQVNLSTRTKQLDAIRGLVTVADTGVDVFDQNAAAKETVTVGLHGLFVNGTQRISTNIPASGNHVYTPANIVFEGSGRGNAYNVQGTPGAEVDLDAGAGNDTFHVSGPGHSLDGFTTVSIAGGGGNDSLTVDDSGASAQETYDLDSGTILGPVTSLLRPGGTTINGLGLSSVSVFAGNRGSTIRVNGSNPGTALAIHGGAGDDTIALKNVATDAPISVDGGGGNNTLDDSGYIPPAAATPPVPIKEFPVPTVNGQPFALTGGPDGNVWFTEENGNAIGRITPTGVVTEFPIPTASSHPEGITTGPDGSFWFVENGPFSGSVHSKIGKITPGGAITEFTIATYPSSPTSIVAGPDGNLWFTEYDANQIGRITPSGVISEFPILPGSDTEPQSIALGNDGNLWFTEDNGMNIGHITPGGLITQFPSPTSFTEDIVAGPDGNLWFFDSKRNIRQITTTGILTPFALPAAGSGMCTGPDGNVSVTNRARNEIDRITPFGVITGFPIPTAQSSPLGITGGPDLNLWFAENTPSGGKIGQVVLKPVSTPSTKGVVVDLPLGKATGLGLGVTRIQNVIGTAFDDILVGSSGGTLSDGPGRDLLIAGPAAAILDGGPGDDILIGGTTASDLDLAALDAILADWSDTTSDYPTRVARLRAGRLAAGLVTSNGGKNSLTGGDGLNLYFASTADLTSAKNGETVFPI
jgi:streptogramin lyase